MRWRRCRFRVCGDCTGRYLASVTGVAPASDTRGLSDLTRDLRATDGDVWVFDPQGVAGEKPTWWNPLTCVTGRERGAEMATNFAPDLAGKDLLAGLLSGISTSPHRRP